MFKITNDVLDIQKFQKNPPSHVGAICNFNGIVRNVNHGLKVIKLQYECFEEMANLEGKKIIEEAKTKFDIVDAICAHRVGNLEIGETAIFVEVFSKHRVNGFTACEYIVDQVKARVPIWKKEFYEDGASDWVKCLACFQKGISHHEHYHHTK